MAKDTNNNVRNHKNSMSQESPIDFSDLYHNEDSIDLTSYMTSANLELCDDELFQSLFPSSPDTTQVKSEKPDPYEAELDWWTDPVSTYSSACSSAAQSPVQFYNTPPVTPQSERHSTTSPQTLRHQLQQDGLSMSRTQFTPISMGNTEETSFVPQVTQMLSKPIKSDPECSMVNNASQLYFVKTEIDDNNNDRSDSRRYSGGDTYKNNLKRSIKTIAEKEPKKMKTLNKESDEYRVKRQRNNVAVRKSRDKAKIRSAETQSKVSELSQENKRLHDRVSELTHELNTLKGILKSLPRPQST